MVRGRGIAVTAVALMYQCALTTRMARGRGTARPNARQAWVYRLSSRAFIGLPCPKNAAGIVRASLIRRSLPGITVPGSNPAGKRAAPAERLAFSLSRTVSPLFPLFPLPAGYGPRSPGGRGRGAGAAADAASAGRAIVVWSYPRKGKWGVTPHDELIMDCRGVGVVRVGMAGRQGSGPG